MDYNKDKVDELTLALLFLVTHDRQEGLGARAWKGFDWNTLDRLYAKDFITNPASKAKSVAMTEDSYKKSEELFRKHFMSK